MAKRKETIEIEKALHKLCEDKRIYGCEEITIGFQNAGKGREIVDFATMDSKGILKCYEIKVSLTDLKSRAKKSWYGHYNYLVVSGVLFEKVNDWSAFLPSGVGLIVATPCAHSDEWLLESKINAKKQIITSDCENMMKESMIRSIYLKYLKFRNVQSLDKHKQLLQKLNKSEKEARYWKNKMYDMQNEQQRYVEAYRYNRGIASCRHEKCRFRTIVQEEVRKAVANGFSPLEW